MTAIPKPRLLASAAADVKSLNFFPNVKAASLRKNQVSHHQLIRKKSEKSPRRLIRISTSDGKWHGKWNLDYKFSLHDLHLQDLNHHLNNNHNEVSINLCIQKHAGFGLSVDGKIITSLTRKCTNCSSPYCREIDTNFNVWVLPSSRSQKKSEHHHHHHHLPEIGGDDPSLSLYNSFISLLTKEIGNSIRLIYISNKLHGWFCIGAGDICEARR
ncbi:hypothetical protein M9H77_09250 [Catharanthus roseus]|uniref:Uncharacterized protein n=1 Tax=Catharanthus roseus TaxID=4058 RepID=A0ACC0C085_CATRO|nr:hypothetical protein M9H77_09250 [Catharanthus roseus]